MANEATIVAPDELLELAPDLELVEATRLLKLAARAVRAYLWPNQVPAVVPPPLQLIVLRLALRIGRAAANTAGAVVSESLGSYTYRLERPMTLDGALEMPDDLARLLAPWSAGAGVYDIDTTYGRLGVGLFPGIAVAGFFERDLDHDDPKLAAGKVALL